MLATQDKARTHTMPPKKKDDKKEEEETKGEIGVYHFSDGSKYDGQYSRKSNPAEPTGPPLIKRHGFGVYTDGDTIYDGQWQDDAMHGEGSIIYDTGAKYQGTFYNNVFNGKGTYTWPDGSGYVGYWRTNKMHGEGTYIDVSGRRWTGRFYDNEGIDLVQEVA